jgi:glycine/serine hydroxymethyltransferase
VSGLLDYDEIKKIALRERPKLIISGASSYPRIIDFSRFREIADAVDAMILSSLFCKFSPGLYPQGFARFSF